MPNDTPSYRRADLTNADDAAAVVTLLDAYACDPFGDGKPLPEQTLRELIPGLRAHPTTEIVLAYSAGEPVGIAICFRGFSTFAARPLLNVHDFFVSPAGRGRGIGLGLMHAVIDHAHLLGCCKVTLEVHEHNTVALGLYAKAGFAQGMHRPEAGGQLFLAKKLEPQSDTGKSD